MRNYMRYITLKDDEGSWGDISPHEMTGGLLSCTNHEGLDSHLVTPHVAAHRGEQLQPLRETVATAGPPSQPEL